MRQWKPYYYNEERSSRTLHLYGCCTNSKSIYASNLRWFNTENEVLAYTGLTYKWCEKCLEYREQLIYNAIKEREDKKYEEERYNYGMYDSGDNTRNSGFC